MTDLATLFTIADKVFQLLQSQVLKDLKALKSDLEKLNKSVSFIKNMLLDVDMKPELSHGEQAWVEELNDVLYEADDLFDEVVTLSKMAELNVGDGLLKKVLDKVSRFFSSKNRVLVSYSTSQEVKSIQQKLDAIAKDHARYDFKVVPHAKRYDFKADPQDTLNRRDDTCSFLDETHENIIGREDDVNDIVEMLLDPNVEENVGFVVIVGIGGLGKTTLARLVYNHDKIRSMFEKKLWVCVSDQDGKKLDVKTIVGDIIESSTNQKPSNICTMQSMQTKLQEELNDKTYLLVLDDVWTEDPIEWSKFRRYLTIGAKGTKVMLTTRSEETAEVVLGKNAFSRKYMLRGLSPCDSWSLFMLTAFEQESDQVNDPKLINIGKQIVKKCSNVPLAIKVLGTLLYGQVDKWESFERNRLLQIEATKNPIMSILKLSYNNLESSVKNCFKYCALFPKDFRMNKRELIRLWMAQGYISNSEESEDCFLILLKRCFFQDVWRYGGKGDVVSFKMHDLMHDVAQEVAGGEIIAANSLANNLSKRNRHIYLDGEEWTKSSFHEIRNIRTCYIEKKVRLDLVEFFVSSWLCLRSLRLYVPEAENLPESIGDLLHLRYLDLSENRKLKTLPYSFVKLHNLQNLIMRNCHSLQKWPKYFYKLVNLRLLDMYQCFDLKCMPLGIGKLTNLRELADFKVGSARSIGGELKDLKCLVDLTGYLKIAIGECASEKGNVCGDSYLKPIKNLKAVDLEFESREKDKDMDEEDEYAWDSYVKNRGTNNESVISKLQPNQNLMRLGLDGYNGTEIPRWGRAQDDWAIILPNLVNIKLHNCERLQSIPMLSHLKHLKSLSLQHLNNLEYVETNGIKLGSLGSKDIPFFSSLEILEITGLKRLKGWWRGVGEGDRSRAMQHSQSPFPRLSRLRIWYCPKLTSLPPCPSLESQEVLFTNMALRIIRK